MELKEESSNKCSSGYQKVFSHSSLVLNCKMKFAIYIPPQAEKEKVPLIYYLSGLTCTEQNFIQKSGFQRFAAQYGFVVVAPDTSPRGCNIPGEEDSWTFGTGAGCYVNATKEPWKSHYQMYSYITEELPKIIFDNFPVLPKKQSIMGHSMGGSGALICMFRNPNVYRSISLFAPACNPSKSAIFEEAYKQYIGGEAGDGSWDQWDGTELAKNYQGPKFEILIDQGTDDEFLETLHVKEFVDVCKEAQIPVIANMREGYDHSYYFISTFIEDHFKYHAKYLL